MFAHSGRQCILSLILVLALHVPAAASSDIPAEAKDAYERGAAFQQEQKYDEAIAIYEEALRSFPKEAALHFALATAYQAKGNTSKAADAYEQAIVHGDADQKKQWQPYLQAMKESLAGPLFEEGAKRHLPDYDAAIELQTEGKFTQAIALYEKLIQSNPAPDYFWAEGTAYQARYGAMNDATQQADLDKAIELYKKAIALSNPKNSQAIAQYKMTLESACALKAAPLVESGYKKQTTELEPAGSGRFDIEGAIADYEAALKYIPNDAGVHFLLRTAYPVSGKTRKAHAELNSALDVIHRFNQFNQVNHQKSRREWMSARTSQIKYRFLKAKQRQKKLS